ncbi:MAG: nicotinate phosphoribosyltransferase, partial [Firmicutes bacterium]|nr:nicotinate phosphoribosyltransferase [Bacillota bacterium]
GARAAIIGGCHGTSNVLAGKRFNVPVGGTHAHSWIMSHDTELNAFRAYAKLYPNNCILLVDTYDTLKSGVPNAITVFQEMHSAGIVPKTFGIRLDSGDLAYLSKESRRQLNAAGFTNAIISASGDLDEYLIADLKAQGATINLWGAGTNLITSKDYPAFGGVYKLAAETSATGEWSPCMKLSENPVKVTNPAEKTVFRLYDTATDKAKADLVTLSTEKIDSSANLTIFDPIAPWKRMTLQANEFTARELLQPVFLGGKCVHNEISVMEIRNNSIAEQATLWDEHKRLTKPQLFPVDLSQKLYDLKQKMIHEIRS